ncbi:MAG TPA: neutral zinc metallopeptidase [Gemmatimonadales bacterium]|nr:neutral zinc metallopeptidase [Gemmatimonadales bacterium]
MRWTLGPRSPNLEDQRGQRAFGGLGVGRIGVGGVIVLLVLSLVFKKDFFSLLSGGTGDASPAGTLQTTPDEERLVGFVSFVFDTAQATWSRILRQNGAEYRDAKLVLFRDAVQSACGFAEAATGPFYCPGDRKVYIDLGFYDELRRRFGAPGDFAQAYVLTHELGHHVQNLLGLMPGGPSSNGQSVRIELQADCFAGIWGHYMAQQGLLEPGDVEEGLGAAAAVGDDRLQKMSTGTVSPDAFTHGTSVQRASWFRRGLESGRVQSCQT